MSDIPELPRGDYNLTSFEAGDYTDNFGNYWCNAAFEGISEPVRWVAKDPSAVKVGQTYYGYFTLETSKADNQYIRFRREQKPEGYPAQQPLPNTGDAPAGGTPVKQDDSYWDDKNAQIRAQWAIGQAVQLNIGSGKTSKTVIETTANELFAMVDRVKGSSESTDPKAAIPQTKISQEEQVSKTGEVKTTTNSGHDKAKATDELIKQTFNDGSPVPDEIIEDIGDQPINLDDIPL